MAFLLQIGGQILGIMASALQNYFFWLLVILVGFQYRRIAKTRENLFGVRIGSVYKDTLAAIGHGLIGGFAGSYLLILTGVTIENIGIQYIWPLALMLMLINPRFLCFSYAGGIIAVASLLLGNPAGINIPQLMALVAVLHMVESILILMGGHAGATPMFTKDRSGNIVGGFTLQKFWPIPIAALVIASGQQIPGPESINMPDWWPLIKTGVNAGQEMAYAILPVPVIAALGYGDLAVARTPQEKSRISARNLSLYSISLLALAVLAARWHAFAWAAALFAPLGHELIIYISRNMEDRGKPVFIPPVQGVMVLEAVPGSPAVAAGIRSGDVIHTINGYQVNSKKCMEDILAYHPPLLEVEYVSRRTGRWQRAIMRPRSFQPLGIIFVPEGSEDVYVEMKNVSLLKRFWDKMFKKAN
ncbi:PDZ domain-containing protein [bacterium]|nr:MAG: PDZ domain-containing protein [bacterium]